MKLGSVSSKNINANKIADTMKRTIITIVLILQHILYVNGIRSAVVGKPFNRHFWIKSTEDGIVVYIKQDYCVNDSSIIVHPTGNKIEYREEQCLILPSGMYFFCLHSMFSFEQAGTSSCRDINSSKLYETTRLPYVIPRQQVLLLIFNVLVCSVLFIVYYQFPKSTTLTGIPAITTPDRLAVN